MYKVKYGDDFKYSRDEFFIPKGTLQGGRCKAGIRTIHAFGGKPIKL